jgi:hypothetical protein
MTPEGVAQEGVDSSTFLSVVGVILFESTTLLPSHLSLLPGVKTFESTGLIETFPFPLDGTLPLS